MNINELFELLQDNVSDELNGEITLHKNDIIWSYIIEDIDDEYIDDEEDEDFFFGFETASNQEKLIEIYEEDLHTIQMTLVEHDLENDWKLSEFAINQNSIFFNISLK